MRKIFVHPLIGTIYSDVTKARYVFFGRWEFFKSWDKTVSDFILRNSARSLITFLKRSSLFDDGTFYLCQELHLLSQLYEVYLPFLSFDEKFRNTLWSEADLAESHAQVKKNLPTVHHVYYVDSFRRPTFGWRISLVIIVSQCFVVTWTIIWIRLKWQMIVSQEFSEY